ncbi:MAG: group II intron reverse transcriptase/maturase [Dehalococcoidia bacterium]
MVARTTPSDKVRELQRTLYRAAKAEPGRRFHALHDKLSRRDVLERAWDQVRRNRGAAGIDRITLADIEQYGVDRLLDELAADLRVGRYRPLPGRRVWIPKPGYAERRPLSIPTVRDRIVQAAAKIVIEPIFEADFLPTSFGFRPRKAAHDALQVLLEEAFRGRRWVVETDIASCFEAIPHERLMAAIEERISDRHLLKLLRALLRAGVLEEGTVRHSESGTPQGGVISPLLANVYLHRLDRAWQTRGTGVLVRYADDLVVMCRDRGEAERSLAALRSILAELGLAPKEAKTRIVQLCEGGEGFDFLGFEHRWVRVRRLGTRYIAFLARWPSRGAMQHARDRIRALTARERLLLPVETVVQDVNRFLRGWAGYFRYGNAARRFDQIMTYTTERLARFVAKRHRRSARYGWWTVVHRSPDRLGLINLHGCVVAPRPNRGWRAKPNAGGEGRR